MIQIKLELEKLNIQQKTAFCQNLITRLSANPYFRNDNLELYRLKSALRRLDNFQIQQKVYGAGDVLDLIEIEFELDEYIRQLAQKVQELSRGNSVIISSAGFVWTNTKNDEELSQPLDSSVSKDKNDTILSWKRIYGARAYLIEISTNPSNEGSWKKIGHSIRTQYTCFNLNKGLKYYIRITVLGKDKQVLFRKVQPIN